MNVVQKYHSKYALKLLQIIITTVANKSIYYSYIHE